MIKRLFDVVTASIGLILLAPAMAVIAFLVKRDSPGPAIFKQCRVGRGGKPFTLLKFRSMTVAPAVGGPLVTAATDTRITKVGAKLRATKMDELPQLINVVCGDMSIVGPRPEVREYVNLWADEARQVILSVRPGITDPATLQLRREEELLAAQPDPEQYYRQVLLQEKARLYCDYVNTRSLGRDLGLILRTLASIVTR